MRFSTQSPKRRVTACASRQIALPQIPTIGQCRQVERERGCRFSYDDCPPETYTEDELNPDNVPHLPVWVSLNEEKDEEGNPGFNHGYATIDYKQTSLKPIWKLVWQTMRPHPEIREFGEYLRMFDQDQFYKFEWLSNEAPEGQPLPNTRFWDGMQEIFPVGNEIFQIESTQKSWKKWARLDDYRGRTSDDEGNRVYFNIMACVGQTDMDPDIHARKLPLSRGRKMSDAANKVEALLGLCYCLCQKDRCGAVGRLQEHQPNIRAEKCRRTDLSVASMSRRVIALANCMGMHGPIGELNREAVGEYRREIRSFQQTLGLKELDTKRDVEAYL